MKRAALAVIAAAVVAGCGSGSGDGEGDDAGGETRVETSAPRPDSAVFESKAIGFTFEYPKGFDAQTKPRGQVLGEVSVDRSAQLNAIKVRKTADRELGPDRYLDEFRRDFERTVGKVEQRRETVGDLDAGVLEFADELSGVRFDSTSYFFKGAGGTWQVECIADDAHREEIEAACRSALETVSFERR